MQYSVLFLTLLAVAQGCNLWSQVCSGISCPTPSSFVANGQSYSVSDFNLISFGSVTIRSGDVEGRVATRNDFNATSDGVSIGYSLSNSALAYSLVAGRNVNWLDGELYPANAGLYVGGSFSGPNSLKAQVTGPCGTAGCLESQFDAMFTYFSGVSSTLAAQADTATVSVQFQQVTVTCSGSASVFFVTVPMATFNAATSVTASGCGDAVVVFNIKGSGAVTFMGSAYQGNALFNIPESASVELDTFIFGSILAPAATVTQPNGTVAGNVVAGNTGVLVQVNLPICPNTTTPSTTGAAVVPPPAAATTGAAVVPPPAAATTGAAAVPPSSTTGGNGNVDCTFLDQQANCQDVSATLGGSSFNFDFGNYAVIVFGDLSAQSGDIEGRTFAYGNVDFSNGMFSVGLKAQGSDYSLIAGGLNFASGSITGRAFVAGNIQVADYLRNTVSGPCSASGCLDAIKNNGQSCYNAVSSTFANRTNANLVLDGTRATLNCNSATDSAYYINVNSAALHTATYGSSVNCNSAATFVFNVAGSDDITFDGAVFPTANVVYNIQGSRTVTVATTVNGAILAPQSRVVMSSGLIVGKVVASSATIVQVNLPDCIDSTTSGNQGSLGNNSAGAFTTPSILVTLIALFIAKMF